MQWVTVSLLLVLFVGTGCCQEPDAGSTEEDSLETNDELSEDDVCDELEKDKSTQPCANDTEGIPITLPGSCGRDQSCRYRLFTCPRTFPEARRTCHSVHGKFVIISNACQNRQIQQIVRYQNACVRQVWIGLRKPCGSQGYTFVDGYGHGYRNWACGQPIRSGNRCGVLCLLTGKWTSLACCARLPFLCSV